MKSYVNSFFQPGLISRYNYPVEVHTVTTPDGYVLQMHRIPHGRDRNNRPGNKTAVFLQHGMLSSSADYVIVGPENSLGKRVVVDVTSGIVSPKLPVTGLRAPGDA